MTSAQRSCTKYLDDFIALKCAPDLLALKVFPNIKEITESQSAYYACKRLFRPTDESVTAVCVGDGSTPRTGALLAFRTKWNVFSVDPALARKADEYSSVQRLTVVPKKIEDFELHTDGPMLIVAVHSHAKLSVCLSKLSGTSVHVVSMPCCYPDDIKQSPDKHKADYGIMSPKCDVNTWSMK
jgi:hypothetical protein